MGRFGAQPMWRFGARHIMSQKNDQKSIPSYVAEKIKITQNMISSKKHMYVLEIHIN